MQPPNVHDPSGPGVFCDPTAFLNYSPRPLDVSSAASVTSRGESTTLRNLLFQKMAELHKVAAKKVNDDTDLEKIKLLFNQTIPTVEKLLREMKKYLRDYSRFADPDDLDDLSERVEAASQEAARFTELVGELYDENEGYAPGLSGNEKATTDI